MSGNLVVLRPLLSQTQPWWPMTSYAFLQWSFRGWSLDSGYPPLFLPIFPLKIEWSNRRSPNLRSPSSSSKSNEWMNEAPMAPYHGAQQWHHIQSRQSWGPSCLLLEVTTSKKSSRYLGKNRLKLNVRNLTPVPWILCASSLLHHRTSPPILELGTLSTKTTRIHQNSPSVSLYKALLNSFFRSSSPPHVGTGLEPLRYATLSSWTHKSWHGFHPHGLDFTDATSPRFLGVSHCMKNESMVQTCLGFLMKENRFVCEYVILPDWLHPFWSLQKVFFEVMLERTPKYWI